MDLKSQYWPLFHFFFRGTDMFQKRKQPYSPDFILPTSIFICYHLTSYTPNTAYIYIWWDLVDLDPSGCLGVSSWPLGSHSSTPESVCVCYTHRIQLPVKTQKIQVKHPYLSFSQTLPPTLATSALLNLVEPPHPCPPTLIIETKYAYTSACAHPAESICKIIYTGIKNTRTVYTPAHAMVL